MSFLYRTAPVIRTAARPSTRLFSTTVVQQKTAVDSAKDGLKTVDRTVSDKLVQGLEAAENVKDKAASAVSANAGEAKGKAKEVTGEAKGKAAELSGEAKGKAAELKGKMS